MDKAKLHLLGLILDEVIEFELFQPKKKDEPPTSLPSIKEGSLVDYTVQRHEAKRAGLHRDIRIGTPKHGLLSWATRKPLPEPGGKIGIHIQPTHPHSYLGWEGEIPKGYGAGVVSTEHVGKALVTKSTPDELHATLASSRNPARLAFVRSKGSWLLARGQHPAPGEGSTKPKAISVQPSKARQTLGQLEKGSSVQPKIDGALAYISVSNRPEVLSHRKSSVTGQHVVQTERFFKGRPRLNIPQEHHGKTLLAEVYGTRGGKAIEPQELGGILNANIAESLRRQKEGKVKLRAMPFDIAGQQTQPYPERLKSVKRILGFLPRGRFHPPEEAKTPKQSADLFANIRAGVHPLTKEGIVIHPPQGTMTKIKNVEEADVKIHSLFPGTGRLKGSYGGFYYPDKKGQPLGKVGTGLSDQTRRDLPQYVGRTARVRYQEKFKSGKLRAPSLIAIHENKE